MVKAEKASSSKTAKVTKVKSSKVSPIATTKIVSDRKKVSKRIRRYVIL